MDELELFRLKKLIKELESYEGRHTELVSVYIPAGYEITRITEQLSQEQGTATNIKSSTTRKNVIDALEKMIQRLKLYSQTPVNGLAIFSGNVSEREGKTDINVWDIIPPRESNQKIYRCDKRFVLDPLKDMLDFTETYGLISMDRREAAVAELKGKNINILNKMDSPVPGKTRSGGQSAHRFERVRDGMAKDFYKSIAEVAKNAFLGRQDIKGILVGGPGPTKYTFANGDFITTEVKDKILAIKDTSNAGEFGIHDLVNESEDLLREQELLKERKLIEKFLNYLATKPDFITYGYDYVKNAIQAGASEIVLVSEDFDEDSIEELHELCKEFSSELHLISNQTREGSQFTSFRVASILRYPLN